MTPRTGRIAAILIVVMTLVPAFAPWATVLGATVNTFSGGAYSKDLAIPPGGGDDMSVALTLPARSTVKRLSMTLTPHPVVYNTSFVIPANGTFAQGTFDGDWMSAGNDGLGLRAVSFTNEERFWDYKGLDNTSTTANVLIEEGLEGVALWPQNSTNLTYIGESTHGVDDIASFSFDGRLIKNLTLNATGTTQFGTIWATVRLWNNQTMQWDTPVNNADIGVSPNHYVLVDTGYDTPVYSKLEIRITPSWAAGTRNMWFNYNITTQAFMPSSMVTSALLDPVLDHGWKESWLIENCSVQVDKVVPAGTVINLSLSNDNGTTWENVTGAEHKFDNGGNDLRWQAELTSNKDNTTPVLRSVSLVCWRQTPQT
jgi:hypothetical protein